jgi:iron complex outermembrane recepter protein
MLDCLSCKSARRMTRAALMIAGAMAIIFHGPAARAQHAGDNAVASAQDAFGLTLGLESVGMYGPGGVRGFVPQAAGNIRIDGLYFDEQGSLSNRVVEGSTIRVGVSEIGYAFPAPTGIVDYELRHPGDGTAAATIIASVGPFEAYGISMDGTVPLAGSELILPIGVGTQVSTQGGYGSYPGYTQRNTSFGATPQWSPNDRVTVRGLFDWQQTRNANTFPLFFSSGDFLPPMIGDGYLGQKWAQGHSQTENFGALIAAQLTGTWSLNAGIFHSVADTPLTFSDLYTAVQPSGDSDHLLVGYPDQNDASTSGEARLTGRFRTGDWHHALILLARGRDVLARYGGDDVVDAGPANIDAIRQVPPPIFTYSARTNDRTELWSVGSAYHVDWDTFAELEVGIQQEHYRKDVISPGEPQGTLTDQPLRGYANSAVALTRLLTLYAGYTQGLEDSGVAPSDAQNRGAVLPASRTWQVEAGLRYLLTPRLKLITGVYELQKPYFNFDTSNVDRELGVQRARGYELSLSGQQLANFDVNLGLLVNKVAIIGPDLAAEGVGPVALGQPRLQYSASIDYTIPWWSVGSLDLSVNHFGQAPGSVDNRIYVPAITVLNFGGRYRFKMFGRNSTLRLQIQNVSDSVWWTAAYTPGYFLTARRSIFAYLTTDI